jgi:hypothetical protein
MSDITPFDELLLDLLPNGPAWDKSPGSELETTVRKVGNIFYVIEFQLDSFVNQLTPETCIRQQLVRFQKELGVRVDASAAGREKAVQAYLATGSIPLVQLIGELREASGKEPKVIEYVPSRSGQMRCGQKLMGVNYIHVYSISGMDLTDKVRAIIRRYKQAHVSPYFIKPDNTVERL